MEIWHLYILPDALGNCHLSAICEIAVCSILKLSNLLQKLQTVTLQTSRVMHSTVANPCPVISEIM